MNKMSFCTTPWCWVRNIVSLILKRKGSRQLGSPSTWRYKFLHPLFKYTILSNCQISSQMVLSSHRNAEICYYRWFVRDHMTGETHRHGGGNFLMKKRHHSPTPPPPPNFPTSLDDEKEPLPKTASGAGWRNRRPSVFAPNAHEIGQSALEKRHWSPERKPIPTR